MIPVAVSGAGGRMGTLVAEAIADASDCELVGLFDPPAAGHEVAGLSIVDDPGELAAADVMVEFTNPDVVMANLRNWHDLGLHVVVGTSGFSEDRMQEVRQLWTGDSRCLIVPNFSVGAVVMMKLAEIAAPHFEAAEVIELHHDDKPDAPSGTSLETARRLGKAAKQHRVVNATELVAGARGASVESVPVHSIRLPGLVAHQAVLFGGTGETLTIRHDTIDRGSFLPGILVAVRGIAALEAPVTLGLESLLGL